MLLETEAGRRNNFPSLPQTIVMERKRNGKTELLKGAAWIALGGFIAKLIGALYRIPLTNIIGGRGLGLYQMVYPVYCLLLTLSATGIPSSIAKLTAERLGKGESPKPLFLAAMKLFLVVGLVGTLLMAVVAPFLARAQGSEEVLFGYYTLAPSVLLVSAISVLRGYFQGKSRMFPTALSEVTEQAVKVGFGLFFAYRFRDNIPKAVTFLLLAVSISELIALLLLWGIYRCKKEKGEANEGGRVATKHILRLSIPVTFCSILIPLSSLLDSVLVPRLLGGYAENAVTLYGLFSGGAITVINLPVSICYGIAAATIPAVSRAAASEKDSPRKRVFFSLFVTLVVAIPAAIGLYLFAEPTANLIFRSLSREELSTLVKLIKAVAVSAITLSGAQTLSACLTAQGKPQYAAISMLVGVTVKTVTYAFWLKNPEISVYGVAYATNLCYLVAFFLDFVYNLIILKKRRKRA